MHRILFNYATRGRRERFFKSLDALVDNLYDKNHYHIHVAADWDDKEMNRSDVMERLGEYENLSIKFGNSESKIHAINRDINLYKEKGDIICNHSDDMIWMFYGFDMILRQPFEEDLDRLVHIPDSDAKEHLATYYIAGKDFFNRFGYIYHPSYKSLFCDNEVQDIAKQLGKYHYIDCPNILFHEHPSYSHIEFDAQYTEQQKLWSVDELNYHKRKAINFGL